jgi:hypothetical protein
MVERGKDGRTRACARATCSARATCTVCVYWYLRRQMLGKLIENSLLSIC